MDIKVQVQIAAERPAMPTPQQSRQYPARDVYQKVCEFCKEVDDGGRESCEYQWDYLSRLFLKLQPIVHKSPEMQQIWEEVFPIILKYAQYDPELAPLLDGAQLVAGQITPENDEDDDA